ncbi:MAG TPA: hypothetical protein VHX12_12480 [Acidisoma sp.]|jgi:hypothetical protein|nr:hypothetical protein [Acidisoma sp.]
MAGSLFPALSAEFQTESKACSNRAAFLLWARALGHPVAPCRPRDGDSGAGGLIHAFVGGRNDIPARLLAGLLLVADLRPDDRLWLEGEAPAWLDAALSMTAGLALALDQASVLVAPVVSKRLPASVRRVILTGDMGGESAVPGITVSRAADWD